MDTRSRSIEYIPLESLKVDERNPKGHSLDTIDQSVGRFGFVEPLVLDGRTGYLISGHGRRKTLLAMMRRGESVPDGVVQDDTGQWRVPVAVGWSSRTDSEAAAALIALNRTTELGGWVDENLLELLEDLDDLGEGGFDGVGFGEDDLRALEALLEGRGDVEPLNDDEFADLIGEDGLGSKDSLTIRGLSNILIQKFRAIEGADDAERFSTLLDAYGIESTGDGN